MKLRSGVTLFEKQTRSHLSSLLSFYVYYACVFGKHHTHSARAQLKHVMCITHLPPMLIHEQVTGLNITTCVCPLQLTEFTSDFAPTDIARLAIGLSYLKAEISTSSSSPLMKAVFMKVGGCICLIADVRALKLRRLPSFDRDRVLPLLTY
jgi:hypothetical protein